MHRGLRIALVLAALVVLPGAGFDNPDSTDPSQQFGTTPQTNVQQQDTPNDPDYDQAEGPPEDTPSTSVFDERFDLFGYPSIRTRATAIYGEGPNAGKSQVSGFNAAGAWKVTRGDARVQIAILDTGINWDDARLRTQVALNRGELPAPRPANPAAGLGGYDLDGNGALDVDDYKNDPRVGKAAPTGHDLIVAFQDGRDDDANGYADDIAGWDFFDDDNDPADASSYFAAANHGSARTAEAVERGDDGQESIGVCPKCQFVPLRIWDTFVTDQNNFALAAAYAADNGVEVVEGADGGLYHSAFSERASEYVYGKGAAQVFSGDDLNTANHNYPANYNHTMLIEGDVADTEGLGMNLPADDHDPGLRNALVQLLRAAGAGTQTPVRTYFRGANLTQFGGHSSISMHGPTGSTNTGKAAGAVGLVVSAGLKAGVTLTPDESRELLEQTAEDVLPLNTGNTPATGTGVADPAQTGFDTHFGYGRANVGEAVRAVRDGRIPPEASIGSPDWYAPLAGSEVRIRGLARDRLRPGQPFHYELEYGLGLAPKSWTSVREADSAVPIDDFGTIALGPVRAALEARTAVEHLDRNDPGGPVLDQTDPKLDPFRGQFTVRLTVTSADGTALKGSDRKVLTALPEDQSLRPGFPKRLGTGGEAPLRYADLDGDNAQELVLPTEDGLVHAYRPGGSELPGWPVRTLTHGQAAAHPGAPVLKALDAPLEVPRAPTIADLTGDGIPEIITAAGERIYAWDARGRLLPGWPVRPDPGRVNCAPGEQHKEDKHPKCGFLSSPAVARLEGQESPTDVVVPGLDGRLRAYRPDGSAVPNFPARLIDTGMPEGKRVTAESINNPAIGDLDGDGHDDVVIATNEVYGSAGGGGGDVSFGGALSAAGTTSRVYAVSGRTGAFLPGWPIKLGGIIQDQLPLIGPGHDASLVKVGGAQQVVVSTTGGPLALYSATGTLTREINQSAGPNVAALNLFESAAVGDLEGAGTPDVVKYQIDLSQAANLLLVGQNLPYSHRIGAFDAATGATQPGFPVITDDYQFLSSSTIAKVRPGASNQVVAGTGLGLLHAYDGITGRDAPGFPKVTGGWLFAPAALSDDGRMAAVTREGFLFEWGAPDAPACQSEWPSFRHDQQGTGNYDADGTPPAAPELRALDPVGGDAYRLRFRSPGDDGFCGTAKEYVADADGRRLDDIGKPGPGGQERTTGAVIPAGARLVTIRARDEAGNLGPPASFVRGADGEFRVVPFGTNPNDVPGGKPLPASPPGSSLPPERFTAKLEVARAGLRRRDARLDVLAPITRLASGTVAVDLQAAGRHTRFSARVDAARGRVRFAHRALRRQARLGTGILTLRYSGDADTRPQVVRLRAASRPARLALARPRIEGGRLRAGGSVTRRARGVVRVQLEYDAAGRTRTIELRARIARGRWRLNAALPADVRAQIAGRRGTVHSYTLFTGYLPARIRGEMRSYQVLGSR
jgi:Subtilase family